MTKELKSWIKQVRAARREAKRIAGTLTQNRATTIPDKRKQASRRACRVWRRGDE